LPFVSALGLPLVCIAGCGRIHHLAESICTLGAYFASRPLPPAFNTWGTELNVYAAPAIITLILLVLETLFLVVALPETRGTRMHIAAKDRAKVTADGPSSDLAGDLSLVTATVEQRTDILATLRRVHFLFLGIFSGIEFTLTFLTFDRKSSSSSSALQY
jgi:hypothetical protein